MAELEMGEELFVNVEESLEPCSFCGRTFLPKPLSKHLKICQRNATRKRKIFDSSKQRIEGTDLAVFHQPTFLKRTHRSPDKTKPSKWREKHIELVETIRAARGVPTIDMDTSKSSNFGGDRCPVCDRQFGPKAFDRHVEWCKERKMRLQQSPAEVRIAKERLEARTKYRVPPPKSKRATVREKYSPATVNKVIEPTNTVKSRSCTNLERSPSIRKCKITSKKIHKDHASDVTSEALDKIDENPHKAQIKEKSVPRNTTRTPAKAANKSDKQDYNPFVTAERQLMELLECDDFKPFFRKSPSSSIKPVQRPHTTGNTNSKYYDSKKNNKIIKSADNTKKSIDTKFCGTNKRASVIDPPTDFQDKLNTFNDDFELIERLVNQNYIDSCEDYDLQDVNFDNISNKIAKSFFLHSDVNENEQYDVFNKQRKYSDDMSLIDPRLINENDNLSIPEHFKNDDQSSNSSNDNIVPLINNFQKETCESNSSIKKNSYNKMNRSLSLDTHDSIIHRNKKIVKPVKHTAKNTHKSTASLNSSGMQNGPLEKKKALDTLRRSISLVDPIKPKNLKNKQDVETYFNEREKRNSVKKEGRISPIKQSQTSIKSNTDDDVVLNMNCNTEMFFVDHDTYEEYKKYEESYLREKQLQLQTENKADLSSGTLTPEGSDTVHTNAKISADSAYSSLNRKAPKARSRATKLAPLNFPEIPSVTADSPVSSGSEKSPKNHLSEVHRISKFCHECGNKYPLVSAKFCIECGVKRLVL